MLREHRVRTLDDRVDLIKRMVWDGDAAFRRGTPEGGLHDARMRQIGLEVTKSCPARNDMCELDAIYQFVKRNIRYTGDITMKDTFQSAWRTLQYGGGDCFPEGTLTVTRTGVKPIEQLAVGDVIDDGEGWVEIVKTWVRGPKSIWRLGLDNGKALRLSDNHKLLVVPDFRDSPSDLIERRMRDIRIGDALLRPVREGGSLRATVQSIIVEKTTVPSYDVMTTSGRVYLPEADVITRNCDDHAGLVAVLAMENGFTCKFRITSNTGATWDHIFCVVGVPKIAPRRWVPLDTTLPRGSVGTHPPMAKYKDFEIGVPK